MDGAADVLAPEGIAALSSFVIRPPRAKYSRNDLGERIFRVEDVACQRSDIELKNARGLTLQCSHYEAMTGAGAGTDASAEGGCAPAVIYLHGNGSCRVEASMLLPHVVPYGLSLFAFDFSGSGKSDGEYITLGVHEKDDVATVVNYLVNERGCERVALWGHSMGAATALMYSGLCDAPNGVLSALVVDSSFQSFDKLAEAMVAEMPLPSAVPRRMVLSIGVRAVRRNVRERAGFDVHDIDPLGAVRRLSGDAPPAFFLHGVQDNIVPHVHSQALHAAYPGTKSLSFMPEHQHDSPRPHDILERIFEFLQTSLAPGGRGGQQYLARMKQRGNACMLNGHFADAAFLYTAALDALAHNVVGVSTFALATSREPVEKTDDTTANNEGGASRQRNRSPSKMRFFAPRTSTASNGCVPSKRRWRSRNARRSDAAPRDTSQRGAVTNGAAEFDEGDSALSMGSGFGGGGIGSHGVRHSNPAPTNVKTNRARNFLQGIRARFSRHESAKRRARSGRFSSRFSPLGDRDDKFRSLGSGTDLRRSDVLHHHTARASPGASRRTSHDQSQSNSRVLGSEDGQPVRKTLFRRMSQSPSMTRLGTDQTYNNAAGANGARRMPRFSHDGWRRLRSRQRNNSNSTLGMRRASADDILLPASTCPDISEWSLDDSQKQIALALLGNRSLAKRKLNDTEAALSDAELCLQLDNTWVRAYLRKAAAHRQAGHYDAALQAVDEGLAIAPQHTQLSELKVSVLAALAAAPPLTPQTSSVSNTKGSPILEPRSAPIPTVVRSPPLPSTPFPRPIILSHSS